MDIKPSVALKAKDFLTEENWCRGGHAMDAEGNIVSVMDPSAVKWCVLGAISYVYGLAPKKHNKVIDELYATIRKEYPYIVRNLSIGAINDIYGYKVIHEMLERADV